MRAATMLAVLALCLIGTLAAEGREQEGGAQVDLPLRALRACIVAFDDFRSRLDEREDKTSKLGAYLADVDNYLVSVDQQEAEFIISFGLQQPQGWKILGGGARYVIDQSSLEIKEVVQFK